MSKDYLNAQEKFTINLSNDREEIDSNRIKAYDFEFEETPLVKALDYVAKKGNLNILVNSELVEKERKVSGKLEGVYLSEAFEALLAGTGLDFSLAGNGYVIITPETEEEIEENVDEENEETGTVEGEIIDEETDQPLPGANVLIEGTNIGASADQEGRYSLEDVEIGEHTLVASFVGYAAQSEEITVLEGETITVNFSLPTEEARAEEVVVLGYTEREQITHTGSVSSVQGRELESSPSANISQSLTGRLPGLVGRHESGRPGADDATLLIRGLSTTTDNSPLVVIDGIPRDQSEIGRIDPSEIESVNVLKDAQSTAIYGSRAANGVILVNTRRGEEGRAEVTYRSTMGTQRAVNKIEQADPLTTAQLWNQAHRNEGTYDPSYFGTNGFNDEALNAIQDGTDPNRFGDNDWFDAVIDDWAPYQRHTLSVQGGSETTRYFVSAGYQDQQGFYDASSYNNYSLRANVDANVTDNFMVDLNLSGRVEDIDDANSNPIRIANYSPRILPIQFEGGRYSYVDGWSSNPVLEAQGEAGFSETRNYITQNIMELTWLPGFVDDFAISGKLAYDADFSNSRSFSTPYDTWILNDDDSFTRRPVPQSEIADLSENIGMDRSLTAEVNMQQDLSFEPHNFNWILVYTQTHNRSRFMGASRSDFASTQIDEINLADVTTAGNSGRSFESARVGILGMLNYDYNQRYMADFNFRYDGSDVFPEGDRFGFFPSVAVGWRLSEEEFFQDVDFVDDLKLRASWGRAGNDRAGNFQYLNTYSLGDDAYPMGGDTGQSLSPGVIPNESFSWEVAEQTNIGIESIMWDGMLNMEVDWFYKRTSDILASRSHEVPALIGGSMPTENTAIVDNTGFDVELSHRNNIGEFAYNVGTTFTWNQSEVIEYPEPEGIADYARLTGRQVQLDAVIGYKTDGLYQSWEEIEEGPDPLYENTQPGDIRYLDITGDGQITPDDQALISPGPTPGIVFGFNIGAQYRGFDLNMFFQGAADTEIAMPWGLQQPFHAGRLRLLDYQTDAWTEDNRDADFPRPTIDHTVNWEDAEFWVFDASYLRLKDVELSYTLPVRITEGLFNGPVKIWVSGSNLFTLSGIDHIIDPETGNNASAYPLVQQYNFGFSVNF